MFKNAEFDFDEEALLIKQLLNVEDDANDSKVVIDKDVVKTPMIIIMSNSKAECSKGTVKSTKTATHKATVCNTPRILNSKYTVKDIRKSY